MWIALKGLAINEEGKNDKLPHPTGQESKWKSGKGKKLIEDCDVQIQLHLNESVKFYVIVSGLGFHLVETPPTWR
ncbi:MAG: hypothetical protein ACYDH1_12470 [Anaerolineaceae bacterium]